MSKLEVELQASQTLGAYLGRAVQYYQYQPLEQLTTETPLFLDTNVLLGYYQMNLQARAAFLEGLSSHNCYACDQVQREFKRHSKKLQQTHRRQLQAPLSLARHEQGMEELKAYLEQNARLLRDYPSLKRELQTLLAQAQAHTSALEAYNKRYLKLGHQRLRQANQSSLLAATTLLPSLTKREFHLLQQDFDQAAQVAREDNYKGFDDPVAAFQYRHPTRVFPGLGDVLSKQKNPYGDYLIYHELLKWAIQHPGEQPLVFLTNDSSKGDWVNASGVPYAHYQYHFKEQTGRLLHIIPAHSRVEKWLGVNSRPLLQAKEVQQDIQQAIWRQQQHHNNPVFNKKNIQYLLAHYFPFLETEQAATAWVHALELVQEQFPWASIFWLEGQLLQYYPNLLQQAPEQGLPTTNLALLERILGLDF